VLFQPGSKRQPKSDVARLMSSIGVSFPLSSANTPMAPIATSGMSRRASASSHVRYARGLGSDSLGNQVTTPRTSDSASAGGRPPRMS
jgi:hypothetical protein